MNPRKFPDFFYAAPVSRTLSLLSLSCLCSEPLLMLEMAGPPQLERSPALVQSLPFLSFFTRPDDAAPFDGSQDVAVSSSAVLLRLQEGACRSKMGPAVLPFEQNMRKIHVVRCLIVLSCVVLWRFFPRRSLEFPPSLLSSLSVSTNAKRAAACLTGGVWHAGRSTLATSRRVRWRHDPCVRRSSSATAGSLLVYKIKSPVA